MQYAVQSPPPAAPSRADRPSRAQIEPAALALLARHSAGLLATARRYSICPQDAEDAYQRGVEILLTKAPSTREDELLPWLRTVVKHEAFAVAKSSARALPVARPSGTDDEAAAWTDDRAERFERLRVGAEALANLKPQEIRCLLLRAEGLTYREICAATGWTYTKVNRSITEGRRAFLRRVASIESGAECERVAPVISRLADGEASAKEIRQVRPHLKSCAACKATLREYRATPARLAGLVPPVVVLAGAPGGARITGFGMRVVQALHERFAGLADMAAPQKAVAIAASAALLAGGGAAGVDALHHDAPAVPASAFAQARDATQAAAQHNPAPAAQAGSSSGADPAPAVPAPAAFALDPAPSTSASPTTDAKPEFNPGTAGGDKAGAAAGAATAAEWSSPAPPGRSPPAGESSPSGGSGEFGP